MRNCLGKKKRTGIQKRTKEQIEEDQALDRLNNHMTYGIYWVAYRELGFGAVRLLRLYEGMKKTSDAWKAGKVTVEELLRYCKAKGIDVYAWTKSLSDGEGKQILYDFCESKIRPGRLQLIEMAIIMHASIMAAVLKEEFKVSTPKVMVALDKLRETIQIYATEQPKSKKKQLTDEDIIETMKEEVKLDLVTGERIKKGDKK